MPLAERLIHTMLYVADLERTLGFYCGLLGMSVQVDRSDPGGGRGNVFVGYGPERTSTLLEFVSEPGRQVMHGVDYGHVGLEVSDVEAACAALATAGALLRAPRRMPSGSVIAFAKDPDGYEIELVQFARVLDGGPT